VKVNACVLLPGVLLLLAWLSAGQDLVRAQPTAQARGPAFEPVDCSTFDLKGPDWECGYVRVPQKHSQPDGAALKLAVAILPSSGPTPTQDAFVVAQGGPGGSAIDTFGDFFRLDYFPALEQLRAERDIVLYDQRGTLYSQPALLCPEELDTTLETIDQELTPTERLERSARALLDCRARLVSQGVDLATFNSRENALDIEDLRRALGYARFDFYGVSYGTLLALHAMREVPEAFRSVILDAVVPTQINPNIAIAQSQHRAFEQLFAACAADPDCDRAFPNLKRVFYELVDTLDAQPARVRLTDSGGSNQPFEQNRPGHDTTARAQSRSLDAVLDGDTFMNLVFQLLYNSEVIPALPRLIYEAQAGRYDLLELFWPLVAFDRTFASGMYFSVTCSEDGVFAEDALALDGIDEHIARSEIRETAALVKLCREWNVPPLGAAADEPVTAEIPTLVLSGQFDPITPPDFGRAASGSIKPSYLFVFPAYGHGALTSGNCPGELIVSFVRDPRNAPAPACLGSMSPVRFFTPATYLLSSGIGRLQIAFLQARIETLVLPALLMLMLTSVLLVGPLTWVLRHAQKRPSEKARAARLAPWFAGVAAVLASGFLGLWFLLLVVLSVVNSETIGLVLGIPRMFAPLFAVPPLFAICALGLAAAVGLAWIHQSWGIVRRVYYTAVAAAALGLTAWFLANDLLGAIL
jgi:pimeloyl-ACP methyl ester carboxylesterase